MLHLRMYPSVSDVVLSFQLFGLKLYTCTTQLKQVKNVIKQANGTTALVLRKLALKQ